MNCGHCGTQVPDGFTVCRGCGANYRGNPKLIGLGGLAIAFGLLALCFPFSAQAEGQRLEAVGAALVMAVPAIGLGLLIVKWGMRPKWYRHNA